MTISINQLSSGMALNINNDIFLVGEYHHVKPGKGSSFVRVKLRNIKTDAVIERTFKSAEKLEDAPLEEKELEYLYSSGDGFHFMDHNTYEQIELSSEDVGEGAKFLLENLTVTGLSLGKRILKVILPIFIIAKITQTEPGIRGDSTKAGTKPARIETGTTIQVPLFVGIDDVVKIDTRSGQYVERVKK
ncbi:MAG: elongation factor P [Candidatus Omnitrophica bacterium]|nr:elongation factor P [Candidatus Omnitrophota bacterium]